MGTLANLRNFALSVILLTSVNYAHADPRTQVEAILKSASSLPADLNTRMEFVSRPFLGKPYLLKGPLGEGTEGKYDQDPLYLLDGFDCTTFIETTYALARAHNFDDFFSRLLSIRYHHSEVSFTSRNHFVEIDWNPNNIKAGIFADATLTLGAATDRAVATQIFSKRKWYAEMTLENLKLPGASSALLETRLTELRSEGTRFEDQESQLPYLKKASLLKLKESLPLPAVLNIVRQIPANGDAIAVTHQVLLLNVDGILQIRQASSKSAVMRVLDMPYEIYVQSLLESPSTLGVQVLQVLP